MICIILSSALAAALWCWRLEAVKTNRLKCEVDIERINSAKWIELHGRKCDELAGLGKKHAEQIKWDMSKHEELEKLRDDLTTRAKNTTSLCNQIEKLRNEIEGLNIDKLALKERLQKFEADQQKRREQKRAGMARYRANKKEGKK